MAKYYRNVFNGYVSKEVAGATGPQGPQGPAGATGPQGPTGASDEEIKINLSNGGSVLDTGLCDSFYAVANSSTITGWYITATPSGSLQVDIVRAAASIPSEVDSITNGNYVNVSSGTYNSDTNLSDWSDVTLSAGDVLGLNIISATGVQKAVITMRLQK